MANKYKQGIYRPINTEKYLGKTNPVYRSGWELKFFRWADTNPNILAWGSENIIIPYINPLDQKVHRYFVDNFIVFKDKDGNKQKLLIEIKPSKQTIQPVTTKGKHKKTILYEQTTWITNQAKWTAAKEWAKKKNMEFIILTEKELNIKT
jgi:hypothetical protein